MGILNSIFSRALPAAVLAVFLAACGQGAAEGPKVEAPPAEPEKAEQAASNSSVAQEAAEVVSVPKECPPVEEFSKTIAATFREGIVVKEVGAGPFDGLCEVVISFNGRNDILYSDLTGRYFVTGRSVGIVDAETKANLTRARLSAFNKFTPEDMAKVDSLAALSVGKKGPVVYFVTDPM